jgi:hypothetical protein
VVPRSTNGSLVAGRDCWSATPTRTFRCGPRVGEKLMWPLCVWIVMMLAWICIADASKLM